MKQDEQHERSEFVTPAQDDNECCMCDHPLSRHLATGCPGSDDEGRPCRCKVMPLDDEE